VIFLDRGLPGEKVEAIITRQKPRYNQGRVLEIVTKSPERIEPRCSHFGICGGCTWQDLDYERQLYYKKKQVIDCIEHIGKLENVEISDVVGSENVFHYRNKMEFSFNDTGEGQFNLGLHHRGHFDEIFDLEKCYLQIPVADEIVAWFRGFIQEHNIPVYNVTSHTGYIRFLMIRTASATGQIMINIVTTDGDFPEADLMINEANSRFDKITTILHNINNQKSNVARGEREEILYGDGYITEKLFDFEFRIYANSFFQTNTRQTEVLYKTIFETADFKADDRLLDLYCGAGTIGLCASPNVADLIGVELEPSAIKAAKQNAELNNIGNAKFYTASVQDFLPESAEILKDITLAVVDPPRAGLHPKALKRLIGLDLPRLVFVSCNPSTFARDAAKLVDAGYKIGRVNPVDMFPHTMHIELVAGFSK